MLKIGDGELTSGQRQAFASFLSGKSIFITGPAGCGKSHTIREIQNWCYEHLTEIGVTALTGTAASIIGGQTLHSWGGLGLAKDAASQIAADIIKRPPLAKRWQSTSVLVIDEVSMMSAELFNKVNHVAQLVRKSPCFFGGLQVILCGDFAQLEPINSERLCFETAEWKKHIHSNTYYLSHIMRQNDPQFQHILSEIRMGKVSAETRDILDSRIVKDRSVADILIEGSDLKIQATTLFPLKREVSQINTEAMERLKASGAQHVTCNAIDSIIDRQTRGSQPLRENHRELLDKCTQSPRSMELAIGAQVMLTKNLDVMQGLFNGSRGVISEFNAAGYPIVIFDNGQRIAVEPVASQLERGAMVLSRLQVPLILAWALTIHKCQGATLSNVITDLRNVFGCAQVYVTLSRVRSLEGLFLTGIDYTRIRCNPAVIEYYRQLEEK
jgi:ATP-dependent DNA helicase PIF1